MQQEAAAKQMIVRLEGAIDDGVSIWIKRPLELPIWPGKITHITVYRKYGFSIFAMAQDFSEFQKPDYNFEVTWRHPADPHSLHLRSDSGLWQKHQRLPWLKQFQQYRGFWFIAFILGAMLGAFFYAMSVYVWNNYFSLHKRLQRGLKKRCFYWLYQPIVELKTGTIVGCEALVRFEDGHGHLFPDQFLPALRASNLTWQFTELMFSHIHNELKDCQAIPDNFKISCNIFPRDIENANLEKLCSNTELLSSRFHFTLEIIEDEYFEHTQVRATLRRLRESGFELSIDDFGTGYSNLKELNHTTFDYLKIDKSFVQDIESDGVKFSIIPLIVDIAANRNIQIVTEGIEEQQQAFELSKLGVQFGQGWLFGKPEPLETLVTLLQAQSEHVR